jgi:hypothetical protein
MKRLLLIFSLSGLLALPAFGSNPEELKELFSNPKFQPAEVKVKKATTLDIYRDGKKSGQMTVPAGRAVKLAGVQNQSLQIQVGTSEASVPATDTDYVDRALSLKQEWDKKSLEEKRAKLIAESPKGEPANQPKPPAPSVPKVEEPHVAPAPETTQVAESPELNVEGSKTVSFLTAQPFRCVENGKNVAVSTFKPNGTYVLDMGYEGKWKLEKNGELVTYCSLGSKERINRYVFDSQNNKFVGKRDRKSKVQDNASLYMMPEYSGNKS